ncbi:MAG: sulfotransferase [Planctomycetota bacterium]
MDRRKERERKARARAAAQRPEGADEAAVNRELARSYEALTGGRPDKAEAILRRALDKAPRHPKLLANLVNALDRQGRHDEAISAARRSIAAHPEVAQSHLNLAALLKFQGDLVGAAAEFRRAVELAPDYVDAWRGLGSLKRFTDAADPDLVAMRALLERLPPADAGRIPLSFAVAKALEELGDFDAAWTTYERGNRMRRARLNHDTAAFERAFDDAYRAYAPSAGADGPSIDEASLQASPIAGASAAAPILIVGMPRSGTTLVEQILASHPAAAGVGECSELVTLTRAIEPELAARAAALAKLPAEALAQLGRDYAARLALRGGDAPRIVDKTLDNHLSLGAIARALPNARFVHVVRQPLDNIVACFKVLFTSPLTYAYDLTELAHAYHAVNRLAERWRERLPSRVYRLEYERLVADQEGETRRLLEFLGLPWSDTCLAFERTERRVDSASATQVRQPLYSTSVDSHRRYERHLSAARTALKKLGYE